MKNKSLNREKPLWKKTAGSEIKVNVINTTFRNTKLGTHSRPNYRGRSSNTNFLIALFASRSLSSSRIDVGRSFHALRATSSIIHRCGDQRTGTRTFKRCDDLVRRRAAASVRKSSRLRHASMSSNCDFSCSMEHIFHSFRNSLTFQRPYLRTPAAALIAELAALCNVSTCVGFKNGKYAEPFERIVPSAQLR